MPKGIAKGKHYSAAAIGLALYLYGVAQMGADQVRQRINTWKVTGYCCRGWRTLKRWIDASVSGMVFGPMHAVCIHTSRRQQAAQVAMNLVARAFVRPDVVTQQALVFSGAEQSACRIGSN